MDSATIILFVKFSHESVVQHCRWILLPSISWSLLWV